MDSAFVADDSPLTLQLRGSSEPVAASKVGDHVGVLVAGEEVLYDVVRGQIVVVAKLVAA